MVQEFIRWHKNGKMALVKETGAFGRKTPTYSIVGIINGHLSYGNATEELGIGDPSWQEEEVEGELLKAITTLPM